MAFENPLLATQSGPLTGDAALDRYLEWEAEGTVSEERQAEIEAERAQGYQEFDELYADTGSYEEGRYHFVDPRNMGSRGDSRVTAGLNNAQIGSTSDSDTQTAEWASNTAQVLDRAGLEAAFNSEDSRYLKDQFGDFDNYMAYMDERQQLIDSGDVDPNWWRSGDQNEQALDSSRLGLTQEQLNLQATQNLLGGNPADAAAYSAPRMDAADIDMEALEASIGSLDPNAITGVLNQDANAKASAHWMNDDRLTGTNYEQQMLEGPMADLNEKYGVSSVYTDAETGDQYTWNGTSYIQTRQEANATFGEKTKPIMTALAAAGIGAAFAPVITGAVGAGGAGGAGGAAGAAGGAGGAAGAAGSTSGGLLSGGLAQGAIQGGISSIASGALNGNLDVGDILQGALTGGITGGLGDLASSGALGNSLDNAIWDVSGVTGLDYDTVSEIMGGVASGAVQGRDLEDILMTAAGTAAGNLGKGWLNETLGQSGLDVDNWFKDGTTNINTEALGTIAENLGDAAGAGKIDIGDVGSGLLDYIEAGGSLGFADPDIKLPNVGGSLPDVDFSKGDWGITQDADGNYNVSGNVDFLPDGGLNFPAGTDLGYIEDAIREAGREFDDTVVQPVLEAGREFDDTVVQPVLEAGREFDDTVLQPIKDALPQGTTPDNPFSTPELPSIELPSIDLPDVGLSSGTGTTPTDKAWAKLFGYTKITPYQKKQIKPFVDYMRKEKGMLS